MQNFSYFRKNNAVFDRFLLEKHTNRIQKHRDGHVPSLNKIFLKNLPYLLPPPPEDDEREELEDDVPEEELLRLVPEEVPALLDRDDVPDALPELTRLPELFVVALLEVRLPVEVEVFAELDSRLAPLEVVALLEVRLPVEVAAFDELDSRLAPLEVVALLDVRLPDELALEDEEVRTALLSSLIFISFCELRLVDARRAEVDSR